jgi:hypothetical protein
MKISLREPSNVGIQEVPPSQAMEMGQIMPDVAKLMEV